MKRAEAAMMAKAHSMNAVNRVEFRGTARLDDPIRKLATAVILQAAIDALSGTDERFYWYRGHKVWMRNAMTDEDYQFYADIAGIEYSWEGLLTCLVHENRKVINNCLRDAAVFVLK